MYITHIIDLFNLMCICVYNDLFNLMCVCVYNGNYCRNSFPKSEEKKK